MIGDADVASGRNVVSPCGRAAIGDSHSDRRARARFERRRHVRQIELRADARPGQRMPRRQCLFGDGRGRHLEDHQTARLGHAQELGDVAKRHGRRNVLQDQAGVHEVERLVMELPQVGMAVPHELHAVRRLPELSRRGNHRG